MLGAGEFLAYFEKNAFMSLIGLRSGKHTSRTQTELSPHALVSQEFRNWLYVQDSDQVYKFDLLRGKPRLLSRIRLPTAESQINNLSVRLVDKSILQVKQSVSVEQMFSAHRQKHKRIVLDKPNGASELEVTFSWNRINSVELVTATASTRSS